MKRASKVIAEPIGKYLKDGVKEAERIAKEIGGHIPERVVDEYIPNDEELLTPNEKKSSKYITIPLEKYEDIIRDAGYYQGIAEGLEKQIEELERPVETFETFDPFDPRQNIIIYKECIINDLEREIERLNSLLPKARERGIEQELVRIHGNIEGLEKAMKKIKGEKCEK